MTTGTLIVISMMALVLYVIGLAAVALRGGRSAVVPPPEPFVAVIATFKYKGMTVDAVLPIDKNGIACLKPQDDIDLLCVRLVGPDDLVIREVTVGGDLIGGDLIGHPRCLCYEIRFDKKEQPIEVGRHLIVGTTRMR